MSLTATTIVQPEAPVSKPETSSSNVAAPLLGALMLTVFAAQKSRRGMRQLRRKALAGLFKYKLQASVAKAKSFFKKGKIEGISDTTLLYILLALLVLVLVFTLPPIVAIIVLLIGILLILLTRK
jgi:hypothetical protein